MRACMHARTEATSMHERTVAVCMLKLHFCLLASTWRAFDIGACILAANSDNAPVKVRERAINQMQYVLLYRYNLAGASFRRMYEKKRLKWAQQITKGNHDMVALHN